MKVIIEKRSRKPNAAQASQGPFPLTLDLPKDATVQSLKLGITQQQPKLTPERQRLTLDGKALLDDAQRLSEVPVADGAVLQVKDLGPQVGWRTTFICEYLGPLLANPLFYYLPQIFYGRAVAHSCMQTTALVMFEAHFLKRLYETIFVHRFSSGTMPFANLIKNTTYYTLLAGANVGFWVYGPWNGALEPSAQRSTAYTAVCIGLFVFAQISNFLTHINLRNLRPPGTRVRKIPRGYGFDLVSCPNYFFEVTSWVAFTLYTRSLASLIFTVVGAAQMYIWAVKKHKNYRREFPNYPKNRKAMIPFIA
ncbi:3-oxo-5a-steroid 4- dehydrogenase [Dispira parvispora]|uniref:3-oxo-5a-steroid 4- dehydrogenase n=1 Tax=Dispira parvispora TaxID=1520584 RepID=A0A9W8E490_9FUNG|nr:3-oxo-5a-steroid 4- dehydrogenase [Dispira parvispora]